MHLASTKGLSMAHQTSDRTQQPTCAHCGLVVEGGGCNTIQAQECQNNQTLGSRSEPDTDSYFADDDR